MDRVLIVSSDCHGGIPREEYRQFLDPKYRADFDDYDRTLSAWEESAGPAGGPFPQSVIDSREEIADRTNFSDSQGRLRDLERIGVASEVIFPGGSPRTSPPWSDFLAITSYRARTPRTRELQWAGEKAYNRWLSEFCLDVGPQRRVGLACMPYHDIQAAVDEVHWAKENGLNGVIFPAFHYDLPEYVHDWYWEPFFAACEEVGFSLNIHGGSGGPALGAHSALMNVEWFWAPRPIWQLIFSGVFDRHPKLYVAVTEATASWVPDVMAQCDAAYDLFKSAHAYSPLVVEDKNLPDRRPSEYWATNGFVGESLVRLSEIQMRHEIGVGTIMYGVDYPHPEGTWGQAISWMQAALGRADVPGDEARLMLGLNAARCYSLDIDALAQVAAKVGPTIDEVLAKPTDEHLESVKREAIRDGFELATRHFETESFV
jgi:predicted TIM-barrel fold metal-dependent hydrolase